MTTRIVTSLRALTVLALPLLVGCYSYRSTAFDELHAREFVHVVADSGFVMQAQRFNETATVVSCRLTRVEGALQRAAADTVWLSSISFVQPAAGESDVCRDLAAGFTTRRAGADLRVLASRMEMRRTRSSVLIAVVVALLMTVVIDGILQEEPVFLVP